MNAAINKCTALLVIFMTTNCGLCTQSTRRGLVSQSNNAVASKIYNVLAKKNSENILVSPISLNYALIALTIGTEGKSYNELTNALNVPNDSDGLKTAYKDFTLSLEHDKNISIATKFFIDNQFQVKENYKQDIAKYFSSEIGSIDLKNNPEQSRLGINKWVEDNTNKRIKDMLPSGSVNSNSVAFIVNAVHFKSDWVYPFNKELTRPGAFHGVNRKFETQMMSVTAHFDYKSDETLGADIILLPYKGDYSMLLLVPHEKKGIFNLESKLNQFESNSNASLTDMLMSGMYQREIQLTMPKFTMEVRTDLKNVLQKIGVQSIFGQGGLKKISDDPNLIVGDIVQKAYINVDETSTEAAAATGVLIALTSISIPYSLNADHPFIYSIVHSPSKGQYFIGRLMEP